MGFEAIGINLIRVINMFNESKARQEFQSFCKNIDTPCKNGKPFILNFKDEGKLYLQYSWLGFFQCCTPIGCYTYKYDGNQITVESEPVEMEFDFSQCKTISELGFDIKRDSKGKLYLVESE